MGLLVLMFTIQTISIACEWYIVWLGLIYYGDAPDQALPALEMDRATSLSLRVLSSIFDLLTALRLAIADSIMVSAHPLFFGKTTNNLQLEGLEVLDHMQLQYEGSDCPSDSQSCVYRYTCGGLWGLTS
jgi:hypothetical protein